jgi:hypothetical protein
LETSGDQKSVGLVKRVPGRKYWVRVFDYLTRLKQQIPRGDTPLLLLRSTGTVVTEFFQKNGECANNRPTVRKRRGGKRKVRAKKRKEAKNR